MLDNINAASRAILQISNISPDSSRNFMFASIASVPPDVPFFPAAYHGGGTPSITIGTESGDIVYKAAERSGDLKEMESLLGHMHDQEMRKIEDVVNSAGPGYEYRGIDVSFAPGLSQGASIAAAIEKISGSPFGSQGTLSTAASITRSLSRVNVKKWGYNGLMLPVLEDEGLGRSADLGSLDLQKLLLYSSVCGTGLDAVPIPGETSPERIDAILSDITYLSLRWEKPLSARILPIPGKSAGEMTDLDSPYLRDCSIIPVI
jgi:hypothetical protein